jgi:dephospho-CoA kinase
MLKVGITGGIGSGKSVVSGIFGLLGVPVYNSDERAKDIMHENDEVRLQIRSIFGAKAYEADGKLNREYIASCVFSDKDLLAKLNAIVHPVVGTDFQQWCNKNASQPYILKEAALIFEAGINTSLDKVILVFAQEKLRVSRVVNRDLIDEKSARARIENQWEDRKKAPLADFIIINDGTQSLLRQTMEIHHFLIQYVENQAK